MAILALFAVGVAVGWARFLPLPSISVQWNPRTSSEEYRPLARLQEGKEVLLVAIVSSNCFWSNLPETIEGIRAAKILVQRQALDEGLEFVTMGVARDMVASAGIEHLEEHGLFDEVLAGRGWLNSGVLQFIYNDEVPGWAATPQVVIIEQTVALDAGARRIEGRREVLRKLGAKEIEEWVAEGAVVDLSVDGSGSG
ncbi:hypothetical protein [Candidatus Palauibacter sp.]|uniref:hypothetical protein n=1 Tax=Candidatus Palauibacter sp. TaxID=3101350 RepID=UPI003D0B7D3F